MSLKENGPGKTNHEQTNGGTLKMTSISRRTLYLLALLLIVIFISFFIGVFEKNNDADIISEMMRQSEYPRTECIYREYEVVNVYRIFDGSKLRYGVDYIDDGKIKTLISPSIYPDSTITAVYPSNSSYLVYRERWCVYDDGEKRLRDDNLEYILYLSNNTNIIGAPTHYSKSRSSDINSAVIVVT